MRQHKSSRRWKLSRVSRVFSFSVKLWRRSIRRFVSNCYGQWIKMAESKGALIAKTMQKHAGRAKEKVFISHFTANSSHQPLTPVAGIVSWSVAHIHQAHIFSKSKGNRYK